MAGNPGSAGLVAQSSGSPYVLQLPAAGPGAPGPAPAAHCGRELRDWWLGVPGGPLLADSSGPVPPSTEAVNGMEVSGSLGICDNLILIYDTATQDNI